MSKSPNYPPKGKKKPSPPPPPPRKVAPGKVFLLPEHLNCIIIKGVWVCMQFIERGPEYAHWQFQGIFSTQKAAIAACRNETYGIGPATIDEELPDKKIPWDGFYFPLR